MPARDSAPKWHPLLATTEPEPGVWILSDADGRPYGKIAIVRDPQGQVRFRAEDRSGTLLGHSTQLRVACERLHAHWIRGHGPKGLPDSLTQPLPPGRR